MAIKYFHYSINEVTHIETKEKWYELSHWYFSEDMPEVAGRRHMGFYNTSAEAENEHVKIMVYERFNK